ncbi:hypothetical protein K3495_g2626 [Podosphaera aphanis]|nr:hypothetical protein K3495_g2626 [Podosphaera aphanis]
MQVYTLKELEKIMQSVASINQMQAKDYLQALQDENLIRVEKIGSGNWYWCFTSDAKRIKEKTLSSLEAEQSRLIESKAMMDRETIVEMRQRTDDSSISAESDNNTQNRDMLLRTHDSLQTELAALEKELACFSDCDPAELARKKAETEKMKSSAFLWTENIEAMESFLAPLIADRTQLAEVMYAACGGEYIIGEGLLDL